jgi:RNA polymerase sigma-70 factor (ECF subfamily)
MDLPNTRASLILRLKDAGDVAAWDEFVAIYEPLVLRLARQRGFQDADARDLVQEVLLAVSRAVGRWTPDPERGRFHDWLFKISRNLMINFLTRRKYQSIGTGDSGIAALLEQECDPAGDESALFDLEYRREVFRWAASQVRGNVKPTTWDAFWLTSVEARPIREVARQLGMTVGSVYIARSRVMTQLQQCAARFAPCDGRPSGTH